VKIYVLILLLLHNTGTAKLARSVQKGISMSFQ